MGTALTLPRATSRSGGRKPFEYREWLRGLLHDPRHQRAFHTVLTNPKHPHFIAATKHAAAYAEGLPIQPTVDLTPPDRRVLPVAEILAVLGGTTQPPERAARLKMLEAIEVDAEVVS